MNFQKPCLPTVDKLYGLVGELRNEIYKNVAADEQLLLRSTGTIEPHRLSTMYTAPPKIQSEYLSLALSYAKTIETTVHNFDFIHVAEFVGERPEEEVKTFLTTDNGRSKRHFIIYMKWTDDFPSALANLKRSRPWAKDPTIEFGYRLKFDHSFQFQVQHNKVQDDQVQDNQVRNDESERIELFHIANLRVKQFRRLSSGLRQEVDSRCYRLIYQNENIMPDASNPQLERTVRALLF